MNSALPLAIIPQEPENLIPEDEMQDYESQETSGKEGWVLKKLNPRHKQICSLMAQGMQNVKIAALMGVHPGYIPMLARQPLFRAEVGRLCELAGTKADALFVTSVEAISDVLVNGKAGDRIKAARLQLELTQRVGRAQAGPRESLPVDDRLVELSHRLVGLLETQKRNVIDAQATRVQTKQEECRGNLLEHQGSEEADDSADAKAYQDLEG